MEEAQYDQHMRLLTVWLPDQLVAEIESESRERNCAKSEIVRERLQRGGVYPLDLSTPLDVIADLIGSVEDLPGDLSGRKKRYLKTTAYGNKGNR